MDCLDYRPVARPQGPEMVEINQYRFTLPGRVSLFLPPAPLQLQQLLIWQQRQAAVDVLTTAVDVVAAAVATPSDFGDLPGARAIAAM